MEDIKGIIRGRKSKKDGQYNGQKKKDIKTNNDVQNTIQKTREWATRSATQYLPSKKFMDTVVGKKINNDKPPTCDFHKGRHNPVQGHSLDLEHELVIKKI